MNERSSFLQAIPLYLSFTISRQPGVSVTIKAAPMAAASNNTFGNPS